MALNDVTFVKGQGGLGRPLDGEDHISGLLYYIGTSAAWPSGFSITDRIKLIFSLEEAEALGIKGDYSNETKATGSVTVSAASTGTNSTATVLVEGVAIGSVTFATAPANAAAVATALVSAINTGTTTHGFTAAVDGTVPEKIVVTAKPGIGNGPYTGITLTASGTGGNTFGSPVDFAGGVDDPFIVLWYHIKEYFRVQSKGVLYVGIFRSPASTWTFSELTTLQTTADGTIRQAGVFVPADFATDRSQIDTLHGVADDLSTDSKKPLSVLFASNMSGVSGLTLTSLPDLSASPTTGSYVSVVIGQDGNGIGKELYTYTGKSITCLGAALGAVSRAKVSENIGWVKNFNLSEAELDVIAFADGTSYRDVAESQLGILNDRHYVFLRKHIGITGSYFNDSHTAVSEASDYATIENNRTIDKAIRSIRTFLVPELNGPLFVDPTAGTLSEDTVAFFQNLASRPLEQMQRDQELSGFQVIINPAQDVLTTSKLLIVVKLIPVGVARQIQVNIGFTVKIS